MISNLIRVAKRAIYTDCEWLRSYEVDALKAFYSNLDDADQEKFLQQFAHLDMMERSPNAKLIQFFDGLDTTRKNWSEHIKINPQIPMEGYQFVAKKGNKISLRFALFLGRGGLGEIQFLKIPSEYQEKVCKVNQVAKTLAGYQKDVSNEIVFEKMISDDDQQMLDEDLSANPD